MIIKKTRRVIMSQASSYPTAISGLTLGVVGICAFWSKVFPVSTIYILSFGFGLAFFLLLPLLLKFICTPSILIDELKHPTVGSVIPTLAMALMIMSHTVGLYSLSISIALWLFAIGLHVTFFVIFSFYQLRHFQLTHMIPSWFVPPIGLVVSCLTVPAPQYIPIAYFILKFGIVSYAVLLPLMLFRITVGGVIDEGRKPSLAIFAAPPSLTLAGYLSLSIYPNLLLTIALFSIAVVMTTSVYLMLFHLLKLKFTPAYSAFTFPLAISATAMLKFSHWAQSITQLQSYGLGLERIALIEGVIATGIIFYVLLHTFIFLKSRR